MSRSEATKRRKVWVEFDEYGTGDDPVVHFGRFPRAVPMVERLPRDVVLSREEVDAIALRLARAELAVGLEYLPWHDSTEGSPEQEVVKDALEALKQIGALLRGRR